MQNFENKNNSDFISNNYSIDKKNDFEIIKISEMSDDENENFEKEKEEKNEKKLFKNNLLENYTKKDMLLLKTTTKNSCI